MLSNDSAQKVFNDDTYGFKNKDNYYKWVLASANHLSQDYQDILNHFNKTLALVDFTDATMQ
jgi:hypothetical protein